MKQCVQISALPPYAVAALTEPAGGPQAATYQALKVACVRHDCVQLLCLRKLLWRRVRSARARTQTPRGSRHHLPACPARKSKIDVHARRDGENLDTPTCLETLFDSTVLLQRDPRQDVRGRRSDRLFDSNSLADNAHRPGSPRRRALECPKVVYACVMDAWRPRCRVNRGQLAKHSWTHQSSCSSRMRGRAGTRAGQGRPCPR